VLSLANEFEDVPGERQGGRDSPWTLSPCQVLVPRGRLRSGAKLLGRTVGPGNRAWASLGCEIRGCGRKTSCAWLYRVNDLELATAMP